MLRAIKAHRQECLCHWNAKLIDKEFGIANLKFQMGGKDKKERNAKCRSLDCDSRLRFAKETKTRESSLGMTSVEGAVGKARRAASVGMTCGGW